MHIFTSTYITNTCVYVYMDALIYACMYNYMCKCVYTYVHVHALLYFCVNMHICACASMCAYVRVPMSICVNYICLCLFKCV